MVRHNTTIKHDKRPSGGCRACTISPIIFQTATAGYRLDFQLSAPRNSMTQRGDLVNAECWSGAVRVLRMFGLGGLSSSAVAIVRRTTLPRFWSNLAAKEAHRPTHATRFSLSRRFVFGWHSSNLHGFFGWSLRTCFVETGRVLFGTCHTEPVPPYMSALLCNGTRALC